MAPTLCIELHVLLFTGKAGLGDNKKGDIYCSLQQCDVPCQITAQVGRRAPPCWGEDETVSGMRGGYVFTSVNTYIHTGNSYSLHLKISVQQWWFKCPLQRSRWDLGFLFFFSLSFSAKADFSVFQFSHGDKHCLCSSNSVRQYTVAAVGGGFTFPKKEAAETANKVNKAVSKNLMKPTQNEMHIRSSECK